MPKTLERPMKEATSPLEKEQQIQALAMAEIERRIRDGTASSQLLTQIMRSASQKEKLELELMRTKNELAKAQTKSYADAADIKKLYADATQAISTYRSSSMEEEEIEE